MRELTVVGLDADGKRVICEAGDPPERFVLGVDDRLRAAVRGDRARSGQTEIEIDVATVLTPKEIQARIRAGATVQQVASAAGVDVSRVERFASPVLLERARAAELATAARPVLSDGPAVESLRETVSRALVARGLDHDAMTWDAWKSSDGRWTVQLKWQAGRSENVAHFRFTPGAHGGTVTAVDAAASELIDAKFDRALRPVAPVAQLDFHDAVKPAEDEQPAPVPHRSRRRTPPVPAWEDVLLGVRSSAHR